MHWIVPAISRVVCLSVISPFSTATCVPPHAACLTRPTPLRPSSRGELIWNQTLQVSCSAWSFYSFYPYITLHKCFFYDWYLFASYALYLCGLSDRGQLQVLRVPPTKNMPICGHGQTTVSICGHLLNFDPSQISSDGYWTGGLGVMTQTLKYIPGILILREGSRGLMCTSLSCVSPSVVWIHFLESA